MTNAPNAICDGYDYLLKKSCLALLLTTSSAYGFCQNQLPKALTAPGPKAPQLTLSDVLAQEPRMIIQDLIVYPDNKAYQWVLCPLLSSGKVIARRENRTTREIQPPASDHVFGVCYAQKALWAVCATDATSTVSLKKYDLESECKPWEDVASVDIQGGLPFLLIPLKRHKHYLGVGGHPLFEGGMKHGSYTGIYQEKEGRLTLETCLDMPFDDLENIARGSWLKTPAREDGTGTSRVWMGHAEPAILTPTLNRPSISDDFLVLGAASAGVLWIFDLEDGRLRHTINLTGLGSKQLAKISPLRRIILGTAFAPDGSLIVASVDPTLVSMITALDIDTKDTQQKTWLKGDIDKLIEEIKGIHWRRIDPAHGFVESLDSPVRFPEKMPSAERQELFRFLVTPEGNVRTNAFTPWARVLGSLIHQDEKPFEIKKPVPGPRMPEAPCPPPDPQGQGSGNIRRVEPAQVPVKE